MVCSFLLYSKVNQLYMYIWHLSFEISFPFRSPRITEWSSLCCPVGSHSPLFYTQWRVCQSQSSSSFYSPVPSWCSYICSLCLCLYFYFANRFIGTIFSRFYIYVLIYNICFSLCDLLHSVWQTRGLSTSLQAAQFHSFFWLSNIAQYMCDIFTPSSVGGHAGCFIPVILMKVLDARALQCAFPPGLFLCVFKHTQAWS